MADSFLGEFMRMFNHHQSRNEFDALSPEDARRPQLLDDFWTKAYRTDAAQDEADRKQCPAGRLELDHHTSNDGSHCMKATHQNPAIPVPPHSVRVWRGFRRADVSQRKIFEDLGSFFMFSTVQIQSMVGLTAYLPSILPADKPDAAPDEIALVFYAYPDAYDEAKETVGGRAYSALHAVAFDLDRSLSGFPVLFEGIVVGEEKYYLFEQAVDWQQGYVNIFVGVRPADTDKAAFFEGIAEWLKKVQNQSNSGPDGAIASAGADYVVYWEHWPSEPSPGQSLIPSLAKISIQAYYQAISPYNMPQGLWDKFPKLEIKGGESFNFQFTRHIHPVRGTTS